MASMKNNLVLAELDLIATDLEKEGHADLATLVDECSADLINSNKRAAAKPTPKKKTRRVKKNRKSAGATRTRNKKSIAQAMRRIARTQISELDSIVDDLIASGDRHAALEVAKIASELDSDYKYSSEGKHSSPESSGDAEDRYDRKKNNFPSPNGSDPKLDEPYPEGEGYPERKPKNAFAEGLEALIREAGGEDDMDFGMDEESDEDDMGEESEDDMDFGMDEESDEDDMGDLDLGDEEGEDDDMAMLEDGGDEDFAAMMDAMGLGDEEAEGEDHEAADRMYESEDMEDPDDLDLDAINLDEEEEEEEDDMGDLELGEEEEEGIEEEEEEEDDMELDAPEDTEAWGLIPDIAVDTPVGGFSVDSAEGKKIASLAKALWKRGNKKMARRAVDMLKK